MLQLKYYQLKVLYLCEETLLLALINVSKSVVTYGRLVVGGQLRLSDKSLACMFINNFNNLVMLAFSYLNYNSILQ